jgi:cysteine-rich repeat protein
MACLDDDTVAAFVLDELQPDARRAVEQHLRGCEACTFLVAEYARFLFQPDAGDGASPVVGEGRAVGRYLVTRLVGHGGGGTVYQAYDPQLKRKVALKVVRPVAVPGVTTEQAQTRLLREAEAMARLQHPNVVAVHDAGLVPPGGAEAGSVFIVMELVEGETLGRWLHEAPRPWREVLDVFVAAGRGLAAAHAPARVHGHFKPENVLVGADARVRVADFGLARPAGSDAPADTASSRGSGPGATLAGGTPLYMAPEQHRGQPPTPGSDQFSFCLALYRAIAGRDPFGLEARAGWARGEGGAASLAGAPSAGAPAAMLAVLARGLAVAPEARHASMDSLLNALVSARGGAPGPSRVRWLAPAAAVVALVAGLGVAALRLRARGTCGNGVVEAGEECDDGNRSDEDGCLRTCRLARCGDGHRRAGVEECDDGPTGSAGCSPTCLACVPGDAQAAYFWRTSGSCYRRYDVPLDWSEAAAFCRARGAELASFAAAPKGAAVLDGVGASGVETWIGLRRTSAEHGFEWLSGETWAEPLSRWWRPMPKPDGEDCVFSVAGPRHWDVHIAARWPTARCDSRRAFICEQPPWTVRPGDGHAYRVFFEQLRWNEAVAACRRIGAHLATVGDPDEQRLLAGLTAVDVWMGARNDQVRGPFHWVTPEPFAYQSFAPTEPDIRATMACIALGPDDLWHDRPCRLQYAYACERE